MSDTTNPALRAGAGIPADDPNRSLTIADPDGSGARHVSVAGDTYTILLTGEQTGGRYTLIDMFVPPGGGPPPHRHDFEEMFSVLEGEIEMMFRGKQQRAVAGSTVNIPANAPHAFKNVSTKPARLLCLCTPAGQEELFVAIGDPVNSRTAPPPKLTKDQKEVRAKKAASLMPKYRTEMLAP